jgi:hypothetical protein
VTVTTTIIVDRLLSVIERGRRFQAAALHCAKALHIT